MRLDSSNVEHVKYLTTEGLDKQQRLKFLRGIKEELDADLFELSTCNRVLYVGFDVTCDEYCNILRNMFFMEFRFFIQDSDFGF